MKLETRLADCKSGHRATRIMQDRCGLQAVDCSGLFDSISSLSLVPPAMISGYIFAVRSSRASVLFFFLLLGKRVKTV